MQEKMTQVLMDSISEVLETMCFLCPIPIREFTSDDIPDPQRSVVTEIAFVGKKGDSGSGLLKLRFPNELVGQITEHLTGRDPQDIKQGDISDALLEITNMVAGAFLKQQDPQANIFLAIPKLGGESRGEGAAEKVVMNIEGYVIFCELFWNFPS